MKRNIHIVYTKSCRLPATKTTESRGLRHSGIA